MSVRAISRGIGLVGVALLVLATTALAGTPSAVADEPQLSSITAAEMDVAPGTPACFPGANPGETELLTCEYGDRGPRLLLVGDSHMRALSPAFRRLAEEGKIRVTLLTRSRCGWTTRKLEHDLPWVADECETWRAQVQRYIRDQKDLRAIITNHRARWMEGTEAQRGPDTVKAWRVALDRKIPVIAVSGAPHWPSTPPDCLRKNPTPEQWKDCTAPAREVMSFDWTVPAVVLARRTYGPNAAFRLDMRDVYCPGGVCRTVTPKGQIMYRDEQHLGATYARSLAPEFEKRLRATGVVFDPPRESGAAILAHLIGVLSAIVVRSAVAIAVV
ncbi:SGNH hydrolase domain-containing protein [Aeromicrobium duanguangcaii]|uniref:SGNH domain-containing protein n=1 Tax=Aeromicrobium duanguangcaii TaxID=2968086 RepID=A0ABY5KF35_9ACTN|nr:SGNH hydrolase domain-containing protein [Aeromicrobium duanguangcaii]MCD9154452.1 hypothetical protein [Aeromicrobium duanguangcaii]UUI68490.1 hypothetical protein NP095_14965 [Aeromicrobium duanguangcaii]